MGDRARKLTIRNTAEQNQKVLEAAQRGTDNLKELRESCKASFGIDILDSKVFPADNPNFSVKAMKEKLRATMREAATGSSWPQLLRAGVQVAFNGLVKAYTDTTYEKWVHMVNSDKATELYAPLHGISFIAERGPQEKFAETQIAGLDLSLNNREYGQILAIDQNLLDDDQTGQLQQLVGDLAEWTKLLFEVLAYGKLASVSGASYSGLSIPQCETKPSYEASGYPWLAPASPFVGGGSNRPATFTALTKAGIEAGINQLLVQKNLLGLIMQVKPGLLTVSPQNQFDAMVLMKSTMNPSTASSAAGDTGGAFSVNPIQTALEVNVSRYVFNNSGAANGLSKAWYIMDKSKPWFVGQLRDPGSVVMENPESGESFNRKVVRHRLDVRCNFDFIEPRFAYEGNDGSV